MTGLDQWALRVGPAPKRAFLLSVGGIASTVLAYWLHQRGTSTMMVSCVFDHHGHGAAAAARTAELLRCDHQVVDLSGWPC